MREPGSQTLLIVRILVPAVGAALPFYFGNWSLGWTLCCLLPECLFAALAWIFPLVLLGLVPFLIWLGFQSVYAPWVNIWAMLLALAFWSFVLWNGSRFVC